MMMVATRTKFLPQTEPYSARRKATPTFLNWSLASTSSSWEQLTTLPYFPLPGSDGVPMENDRERLQINLGLESLDEHWKERTDFFAGGNMFVYYSFLQAKDVIDELNGNKRQTAFRGPDMFMVLDVDGSYRRQKWVTWQEDGRYPNVIFEFLSPSTRNNDLGKKKKLYEQTFKTEEYFCFDYFSPQAKDSLLGFRLVSGRYQAIKPNEQGWLWSEKLGLWVGTWLGTYKRDRSIWMRFYTKDGDLVLIESEAEQARADAQEARADVQEARADVQEARTEVAEEKAQAQQARADVAEEKAQAQQARSEVAEEKAQAQQARADVAEEKAQAQQARAEAAETEAEAVKAELARLKALFAKQGVEFDG